MSLPFPIPQSPIPQGTRGQSHRFDLSAVDTLPGDAATPDVGPAEPRPGPAGRPSPQALLEGLNGPQREAVRHAGAPLLVVAGAGSGKTRVLTRRIAWLIAERKAHPGSILAITFTNKAAAEMRERVEELVGRRARVMWVSTFHSACVRILRKEIGRLGFTSSFSIYDAADSKRLMTLVCRDLDLDPKRYPPRAVLNWVSNAKNELVRPEDATKDAKNHLEETYALAYATYQRRLREANALDFDDLILTAVHLFATFPEVRETYRRRFRHVLVDEYQDTNSAQYALIRELCADGSREVPESGGAVEAEAVDRVAPSELMVVGDADQSIYAFRGANIRNILRFEEDFPDAAIILLEQNYRSTQTILNAANAVISRNQGRTPKKLWSDAGAGEQIVGYVADDEHDEARFVSEEIDKLTDAGTARPGDVAVFYRTNAQSRVFEEVFIRVGMPYRVVGGVRFYERKEVRDALAYLRMLVNPADEISLRRILNTPRRGIGDRAEACVQAFAERERISFWEALCRADEAPGVATRSLGCVTAFVQMVQELQSMVDAGERADVVLEQVLARSGYLAELEGSDDPQDETRVENLAELVAVAREFADEPPPGLADGSGDSDADGDGAAGRLGGRLRPDPRPAGRREQRSGHLDDAAHRQGTRVPGGLPDRPRGRDLPAHALAGGPLGAGGGAATGLRRRDPCPRAALRLPGRGALRLGRTRPQPGIAFPRRAPRRPRRLATHRGGSDVVEPAGHALVASARGRCDAQALRDGGDRRGCLAQVRRAAGDPLPHPG
jgi:DNA helicase-2/ATP-dependent DNA helicase PcrA